MAGVEVAARADRRVRGAVQAEHYTDPPPDRIRIVNQEDRVPFLAGTPTMDALRFVAIAEPLHRDTGKMAVEDGSGSPPEIVDRGGRHDL